MAYTLTRSGETGMYTLRYAVVLVLSFGNVTSETSLLLTVLKLLLLLARGRDEIESFLVDKWKREKGYRLRKELFSFTDNKVSSVNGTWP